MNSRALSAKIVVAVYFNKRSLSDVFTEFLPQTKEAPFVKALCFGTLRFAIQLEVLVKKYLTKTLKDNEVFALLLVGFYQVIHTDTPLYATVNETVAAARQLKKSWACGLTNKLLRLISSAEIDFKQSNVIEYAHPDWLIGLIKNAWPAQWKNILGANNQQAPLFLRVNQQKISLHDFCQLLEKEGLSYELITNVVHAVKLTSPLPVEKIPGFSEGFFSVQDITGQKIGDYFNLDAGARVLDACAAPGSKTTLLLEHFPGIKITSIDISAKRLEKITDNIKRLGLPLSQVTLMANDCTKLDPWWDNKPFDAILIDAPCSATGVIRRHPDIKCLRQASDIPLLAEIQLSLLKTLWQTLMPGGICLYTTCSILPAENDQVIAQFLQSEPTATTHPIKNNWGIATSFGQQVITGDNEGDGFYYACLKKTN